MMKKSIKTTSKLLILSASASLFAHATIAPQTAQANSFTARVAPATQARGAQSSPYGKNKRLGNPYSGLYTQIPTPRCDGFEDYVNDMGEGILTGVEYLGEKTIRSTIGMGKLLSGDPTALIDEVNDTFTDLGTAAGKLTEYTPLALISVIVDQLPDGEFTDFLKTGARLQQQMAAGIASNLASGLNPLTQMNAIYGDGTEIFGDISKILVNLDDPLAAGNEFLKLNQKWTGAGALTYILTEDDPMTGMKKALNAMHRQVALVGNHAGPNGAVAGAVFNYAMGESKKLIDKIPDPKQKEVATLLAVTFAASFKQSLNDPDFRRSGYNVTRHPFYFAEIREIPTVWMGNDHNSGGKIDWGMSRPKIENYPDCISLGDYAYNDKHIKRLPVVCGVRNGKNKWWSRPIDYALVWGDNCSGGTHDRSIWQPVCKDGYVSVGFVAGGGSWRKPSAQRIACIKDDPHIFTVTDGLSAGLKFSANDAGSGAKFDVTTYERSFEGLKLSHMVPLVRGKNDQRFIQSLRIAVDVPGLPPSGKQSHCVHLYSKPYYRGRTTRVCATNRPGFKKSTAGGNNQMKGRIGSIQCGEDVVGLNLYSGNNSKPFLLNCRDKPMDGTNGLYDSVTHIEPLTYYIGPYNTNVENFPPKQLEIRAELEKACGKGINPKACLDLAQNSSRHYEWATPRAAIDTVKRFGYACEGGIEGSCKAFKQTASKLCNVGRDQACDLKNKADKLLKTAALRKRIIPMRAACTDQSPQSCNEFAGALLSVGKIKSAERVEGLEVLRKLCDANYGDSCQRLKNHVGVMCLDDKNGMGCTVWGQLRIKDAPNDYRVPNMKAAIKDFEKACNYGDDEGCTEFVRARTQLVYHWSDAKDFEATKNRLALLDPKDAKAPQNVRAQPNVLYTLSDACDRGYARACDMHDGYNSLLDEEKKTDFYKCDRLNDATACTAHAKILAKTENSNTPFSTDEGSGHLLRESCRGLDMIGTAQNQVTKGDGEACFIIANKTLNGEDGTQPHQRELASLGYFAAGCELDHAESCLAVAKISRSPRVPAQQGAYAPAAEKKACDLGNQEACALVQVQEDLKQTRLIPIAERNRWGQSLGDGHQTTDTCFERATIEGFSFQFAQWRANDLGGELNNHFSNSGPDVIYLKRRSNMEIEEEIQTIHPGQTVQILDNFNRWIVVVGPQKQKCLGVVRMVEENQHFVYSATGQATHSITNPNTATQQTAGQSPGNTNGSKAKPNTASQPNKPQTSNGKTQVALGNAKNCELRGSLKSVNSNVGGTVEFQNAGSDQLFIYWLDENGSDTDYQRSGNPMAAIAPGATTSINTAIGLAYSVFSVVNGQTICVGVLKIDNANTLVTMNGAGNTNSANQSPAQTTQNHTNTAQDQISPNSQVKQNNQTASAPDNTLQGVAQIELHTSNSCLKGNEVGSRMNGADASVSLTNAGSGEIYVFWRDENGDDTDYNRADNPMLIMQPGDTKTINSRIGFVHSIYLVENDNPACEWIAEIANPETNVTIHSDMTSDQTNQASQQDQGADSGQITQDNSNQSGNQLVSQSGSEQTLLSCNNLGSIASNSNGTPVNLSFYNDSSVERYLFWIDENGNQVNFDGAPEPVLVLAPNESRNMEAQIGDVYSVTDATSNCIGLTPQLTKDQQYTVN